MKWILSVLLLFVSTDPTKIGEVNDMKKAAKRDYEALHYQAAAQKYRYLIDSLGVNEDEVALNLANALFQLGDSTTAAHYSTLVASANPAIQSKALQQLGVLANRNERPEQALEYFKKSVKANPVNDEARFNYEMVKKKLDEQKNRQDQNQQNDSQQKKDQQDQKQQSQQNKDQQNQQDQKNQQDQDQQKKEEQNKARKDEQQKNQEQQARDEKEAQQNQLEKQNLAEKLKDMNMSEEKARMILEAMRNQEIQYLQQKKRKSNMPRDNSKPDW